MSMSAGQLALFIVSLTQNSNGVCSPCEVWESYISAHMGVGFDSQRRDLQHYETDLMIEDRKDEHVSNVGISLWKTGRVKGKSLKDALGDGLVSIDKVHDCLLRSSWAYILRRREIRKNGGGGSFAGTSTNPRWTACNDVKSSSENLKACETDPKDRFSRCRKQFLSLVFSNPMFQRISTCLVTDEEFYSKIYLPFLSELRKLKGYGTGVPASKTLQLLAVMGLIDPRFFDQGKVVKDTGPYNMLKEALDLVRDVNV